MKSQTTTIISEITTWKNKYEEITKDDQQLIIDLKKIDEDLEELRKKKKEE